MNGKLEEWLVAWFGPSYKTKAAGLATIGVTLALLFGDELGITPAISLKITQALAIITGAGLAASRQHDVTSERSGAR